MRHRSLALLALVVLVAACGDDRATSPSGPRPGAPTSVLSDGSKNGNKDFFFLPPLVPNPGGNADFDAGQFNPLWQPIVAVCRLNLSVDPPTCTPAQTFAGSDVKVDRVAEHYQVNLDTRATWATQGLYRAYVIVQRTPTDADTLGFIDLELLPNQQAVKNYQTLDVVPLMDGRTVPLKFRIEHGATVNDDSPDYAEQPVTNAGGIVRTVDAETGEPGDLVMQFAPGWLGTEASEVVVTISQVDVGTSNPCVQSVGNIVQTSNCWRVTTFPDIQTVHADVVIAFCPTIADTDPRYDVQAMYKFDAGPPSTLVELEEAAEPEPLVCEVPPPPVIGSNLTGGALGALARGANWVAGGLGRLFGPNTAYALDAGLGGRLSAGDPAFSDFFWGVPMRVDIVGANPLQGIIGQASTVTVRVTSAKTHHEDPPVNMGGIVVTAGPVTGGTLASATATTLGDGTATFAFTPTAATGSIQLGVNSVGPNATTTLAVSAAPTAIACTNAAGYGGDLIDRGFYVGSYPGTTLDGANLRFSAITAGTYEIQLTARAGGYGTSGTLLAQDTESVVIPTANSSSFVDAAFRWPSVNVTPGTTVTFEMTLVSGPTTTLPFYAVPSAGDTSCPVTQTNGTTPPLDTIRRQGVHVVILGSVPIIL